MKIHDLLQSAAATLAAASDSARLDAEVLLAYAMQKPRSFLFAHGDEAVAEDSEAAFDALLARRRDGEPIAYITGEREFWSMPLKVTPDTLIPRPDTERLVEIALQTIDQNTISRVADLGTGSGAIALAIAKERPNCRVTATDVHAATLDVAARNARALSLNNVEFVTSDWTGAIGDRRFDLVVSNPPYVAIGDAALADLRYEPARALESGADGLDDIRRLVREARDIVAPGGWLLLEHGADQGGAVQELFDSAGWENIRTWNDYAGHARVTGGTST